MSRRLAAADPWQAPLLRAIVLHDGTRLDTLHEARAYIIALPADSIRVAARRTKGLLQSHWPNQPGRAPGRVGIPDPPFEVETDSTGSGFDAELMQSLEAERLLH